MNEAEKPTKIPCSGPGNLVGCQVSHISDGSRYFRNVRRLVSLSSMRQGSQKRRIGLHQQTVERNLPGRIAQVLRLRIAHISRERYQKTHIHAVARFLYRTRETVENSPQRGTPPILVQYFEAVRPCLPAMD